MELIKKIQARKIRSAVIGLGYVGLPLAVELARAGVEVVGIDTDKSKVDAVNRKKSYIRDVPSATVRALVSKGLLSATTAYSALMNVDTVNICVPTPLRKTKEPDISFVIKAAEQIARYLRRGQLVILESTTYPGTTEEVLLPLFEAKGLKVGKDFCLAFSPERVDPANPIYTTRNIPKVVGGVTPECTEMAALLFRSCLGQVVPVSSTKVAEMVKLLENTFRSVNIGLVNEIALMCHRLKIDVWEVIQAAATKPFGFMPFYPGPGLGGHCIPIDPFYLTWKARQYGMTTQFIELAGQVNTGMPRYVVQRVADALNERRQSLKGSRVLVLGLAYKPDIDDVRESPSLELIELLRHKGAKVDYNDPYIPQTHKQREYDLRMTSKKLTAKMLGSYDVVLISTNHSDYDYPWIVKNARLVVDTRNATANVRSGRSKIVKA